VNGRGHFRFGDNAAVMFQVGSIYFRYYHGTSSSIRKALEAVR